MSAFHYKAELIEKNHDGARYRFYLDFVSHEDWQGVAVIRRPYLHFVVESRQYDTRGVMQQRENRCLSALQYKLRKMVEADGELPLDVYHIA